MIIKIIVQNNSKYMTFKTFFKEEQINTFKDWKEKGKNSKKKLLKEKKTKQKNNYGTSSQNL